MAKAKKIEKMYNFHYCIKKLYLAFSQVKRFFNDRNVNAPNTYLHRR